MTNNEAVQATIRDLLKQFDALPRRDEESEKRTEEFLRPLLEALGWAWLSSEVRPQSPVRGGGRTTRVDYSFKRSDELRPSFYVDAKRFSKKLDDPGDVMQVLGYGKNSGTRWVALTNFVRWRVFNADYFDDPARAELFEFDLAGCLVSQEHFGWLLLLSRENGGAALDAYAKAHKKWKESADVEDLLTRQLLVARKTLGKAILQQNLPKFDTGQDVEKEIDACVQTILDRIIFCRALEDCGGDPERRLQTVFEKWKNGDKRVQFYRDFLCPFFIDTMHEKYDSTIFDLDRVDRLSIKNEDFIPVLEAFYEEPATRLRYRFDVLTTDVLGHAYENYLSYKATAKRKGVEEEAFKRKQGGVYYTPEFLVDFLVTSTLGALLKKCRTSEEALRLRVVDPACGSGTFLVRAFEEFKGWYLQHERAGGQREPERYGERLAHFLERVLEGCLYGIDIDPRAVRLARLNLFLRSVHAPKTLPKLNVIERDSLVWDGDIKNAFKLERDFPLVAEAGGFDVVVGNPPWEKWKPNSQEFFEPIDPGFSKLPTQEAKKRMAELLKTRIGVRKQWLEKLNTYEMYSELYRTSYRWQSADVHGRMVSGDLDLYKVFTERAYMLLKTDGLCGFVVPSGIYTDLGAKGLRTMLFEHAQVKALYSFENRKFVFRDIDQRYKFVLLVFERGGTTHSFPCAFFLHSAVDLDAATKNPTIMDVGFVRKASPSAWSVLEIKTPRDYGIVKKLLKHPLLGEKIDGMWNVQMQSGFHMTNDSHLFQTGKLVGVPLLEGKNIHQFTHQWKEAPVPRYKVYEKDIEANLKPDKIYHKGYWMAYRLIARSMDYRTFIATLVPPGYVCGHSIAIVRVENLKALCYLIGSINSLVLDYFIRQKVSANVTMFNFLETPVPRLSSGREFDAVVRKVAQLVCTTDEFAELKKEAGIGHGLASENDRALARAQLDVTVAKLYGITKDELRHILEQFPLVEQRQKGLVLSQYE